MKKLTVFIALLMTQLTYCQTIEEIDALTLEMCTTLKSLETKNDSVRINFTYEKHLPDFLSKYKIADEKQFNELFDRIFFRFQKNCIEFVEALGRVEGEKGDWEIVEDKPAVKIEKSDCRKLEQNIYYKEYSGEIVNVTIADGYWTENFDDGTFSKLYFSWKNDCEFELEFIESNNAVKKNLSIKGDIYSYGIYAAENGVYDVWTKSKNYNPYILFKLYTKE